MKYENGKLYVLDQDKNWIEAESARKSPNQ